MTLIDLGELGKWSKETFFKNCTKNKYPSGEYYGFLPNMIEDLYYKKWREYSDKIRRIRCKRVFAIRIDQLEENLITYRESVQKLEKLEKDYEKAKKLLNIGKMTDLDKFYEKYNEAKKVIKKKRKYVKSGKYSKKNKK